ncbi:hypothetical protein ACLKA6_017647 [Drosophila palustris]
MFKQLEKESITNAPSTIHSVALPHSVVAGFRHWVQFPVAEIRIGESITTTILRSRYAFEFIPQHALLFHKFSYGWDGEHVSDMYIFMSQLLEDCQNGGLVFKHAIHFLLHCLHSGFH